MNARKRVTNRAKTAGKNNIKTGGGGKVVGLDVDLVWATNLLAGRRGGGKRGDEDRTWYRARSL